MPIIIKNGTIVTTERSKVSDVKVDNGKIVSIGDIIADENDIVIDATGKYLLPGAIDSHTHLDLDTGTMKTADDFYTGTKAAIAGGTTTIIDFATQNKGGSLKQAVDEWQKKADVGAFCDYGFHMAIIDWNESICEEMQDMVNEGISSFKLYMAYKNSLQVDDGIILEALCRSNEVGGIIGFHCENGDMIVSLTKKLIDQGKTSPHYHPLSRPDILEQEAIYRLCKIAEIADAPVWVVHLSSEKGLDVIQSMKKLGIKVVTESCPQYLILDDSLYGSENDSSFNGGKYVMSPPLRKQTDVCAMWRGIEQGTIDFISTDHCSFNFQQKKLGEKDFSKIPNGGPGIEHRLNLLYNFGVEKKRITINKMVDLLSTAPSKFFGLDNKGSIEQGKDADIVIFDPDINWTIKAENQVQNVDYTPYEGYDIKGKVETVFLRGQKIYENGTFINEQPQGTFQKRSPFKFNK